MNVTSIQFFTGIIFLALSMNEEANYIVKKQRSVWDILFTLGAFIYFIKSF